MSVPISSADLSRPEAGGALAGWEQPAAVTSRSHVPHAFTPAPTEAVASESPPPVEPQSDTELLSAFVQRRDADAFTEIVQRYRLLVYRVALRAVDDRHLADDVFQATFLVLAQSADKIKRTEALAAWLHGTTRNIARRALGNQYAEQKQLKDWAKQTLAQKGEEMATSTEADPFEELARRHEQQLLDEELQQLPESSRAPLVLFYLEKKTQAEIAQIMGLSVEAVEGRLKRAKQELRTRLIRRGVLLSTVVAAATVLTPSITFAAPAASLVSTTVTTALGTAALGSTALGATAVTGAATSSQLAAGSATASTLAAQEIAIMSVTSKATAMLITTAASTTLISGLVLGGMVGMFSVGAGGSVPPDELSLAEMAIPQEINDEALRPNLLSLEGDDLVQIALVEPEVTKESEEPASAPAEKVDENPNELKPFVYYVGDLTADDLLGAEDFAQSLGFSVLERRSKHFIVVHATTENDRKLADHFREIRQKRDAKMSLQFELLSARAKLAKLLKEFDESHPNVKQARSQIAVIEKELAQPTQKPRSAEIDPELVQVVDKTTIRAVQDGTANITVTDVNGKTATTQVEVPRQYIRSVSLLRNLTPVEKTIYEVLRRQEQLEFPEQTLDQFAESLSAKYQIPVKVDWQALEAAGVAKSATVSLSGLKRIEHALTDILSDVGGQRLEFFVDNGELHFTTQEAMRTTTRVREYDLSSLGEGHLNYDLPFPGDGELDFALQYADSLSQEITRQGKVLSFNAPLSNHKKFERFLAMLPELLKEPISTNASPVPKLSIEGDEASVSGIANQPKEAQAEEVLVSLFAFATDDESIKLLATKGEKGFIVKPKFRKNLESLLSSGKAEQFADQSIMTRVGQPTNILSGGEFSIPSAEAESSKPNAMTYGIGTQLTLFDKRGRTGQRVLKYNLEVTGTKANNSTKIDGNDFHSVSGKVMRGYAEVSGTGTDEILLGPMDTGETRSPDGVMRKVSIYLRILVEYE